jgi:hypothetical protein
LTEADTKVFAFQEPTVALQMHFLANNHNNTSSLNNSNGEDRRRALQNQQFGLYSSTDGMTAGSFSLEINADDVFAPRESFVTRQRRLADYREWRDDLRLDRSLSLLSNTNNHSSNYDSNGNHYRNSYSSGLLRTVLL